ncbi:unnamed protein product [Hermetia illucens]|uniref:Uncharacterized protein n=1 Tax=Hermetia illucens TaxID=343691 RepID=A0A7R8UFS8_HERIL|nr:unnamed protein product [Hermetia illucens]
MDWTKRKNIKLRGLTAKEVEELLNSVESEDYSSDDSVRYPDSGPNWDEIAPEDDAISQHLDKCGDTTAALIDPINLSVNSSIDKTTGTPFVEQPQPSTSAGWGKPSKSP